jgi:hypothetical protein
MVQLIVLAGSEPFRHRLHALAVTRTDQPSNVERAHPPPRLMTQAIQKGLEPAPKLIFPLRRRARHGQPSKKPTTHESSKIRFGNPVTHINRDILPK